MHIRNFIEQKLTEVTKPKYLRLLTGVFSAVLLLLLVAKIVLQIVNGSSLEFVAGVWSALASDLKDGLLYRPVFSDIGLGGTRYMPLYISLQAVLMHLPVTPLVAGHCANIISGILLLFSIYMITGREKLPFAVVMAMITVYLSLGTVQNGFTNVGSDMLPLALTILGVASVLKKQSMRALSVASLFFVLAFSAKLTAMQGFAAVVVWFVLNSKIREAIQISLLTLSGYILVVGIISVVSGGRFIEVMTSCASSGTTLNMLVKSPMFFTATMFYKDALCLLLFFWAFTSISTGLRDNLFSLPFIFWVMTILQSTAIFASPGTNYNHLVDIGAASIILIGWSLSRNYRSGVRFFSLALGAFLLISICINYRLTAQEYHKLGVKRIPDELVTYVREHPGALSEDPLPIVHADQKPFLLDPFMARQLIDGDETIRSSCIARVEKREFPSVIFAYDPQTDPGWYRGVNIGGYLFDALMKNYEEKYQYGAYRVYEPRSLTR